MGAQSLCSVPPWPCRRYWATTPSYSQSTNSHGGAGPGSMLKVQQTQFLPSRSAQSDGEIGQQRRQIDRVSPQHCRGQGTVTRQGPQGRLPGGVGTGATFLRRGGI